MTAAADPLLVIVSDVLDSAALTFTAHNIVLPDGTETLRGAEPVADNGICLAALRDLALAFPGVPRGSVRVADLGCLEGGHAAAFAQAGYNTTGFEVRAENFLCCRYVENRLALPNLHYVRADVRDAFTEPDAWDAVFCCGLLYHLDNPVAFLRQLGKAARRLLIVQAHYSTRPDAVHEGHRGHWYDEPATARWASWQNARSFWLTRKDLLAAMRDAGFGLVFEQADFRDDILADDPAGPDERSMFVGLKTG
jgi:SAM-dependent methyltransferase